MMVYIPQLQKCGHRAEAPVERRAGALGARKWGWQWSLGRGREGEIRWDPRRQETAGGWQGVCSLGAA